MTKSADSKPQLTVVSPEVAPATQSGWRRARSALRWLATAVLIGWLAASADWTDVRHTFATASVPWLLIAAGTYLASQLASVVRWEILVRAAGFRRPRRHLVAAYFEGMFVNVCLPTTLGGDLLKVFRIGGAQQKRLASSTVAADRTCGLAALLTLLVVGLLLKMGGIGVVAAPLLILGVVIASLTASWALRSGVISLGPMSGERKGRLWQPLKPVLRFLPMGIRQLAIETSWARVMIWAFVVQTLNVTAVAAVAGSIGLDVSPIEILVATTTVSLAAALPISIAGIGVREASLPLMLAADGVPRASGIALGMAWSGIVLAIGLLGGPIHFAAQRRVTRERVSTPTKSTVAARRSA
ncbi:MAG TPA: lysylphosphatidylglycerol synthase transmembrane domain-containing protein [Lacipirellulaceae bacterium]|nr:lysylphosphatidylglycerol synthase transmembrane domain-containing protein [Lacipirellulaceae bacterium]